MMDRRIGRILLGLVGCGLIVTALVLARGRKPSSGESRPKVNPEQAGETYRDRMQQTRRMLGGESVYAPR